jgi:hypothetical protein
VRRQCGGARAFGHVVRVGEQARMAAATSASLTCTMWSMCGASTASASWSATRQAMPSASCVVTGASTTRPAASESA